VPAATVAPYFLAACAALFTAAFALPMLVAPLAWARRLGWSSAGDPLTVYFGRCLGGLLLAVTVAVARAAADPPARQVMLELMAAGFAAMTWVHLLGWWRRTQPWLETAELPGFVLLTATSLWLRFSV
jgi:hypothetical protein